MGAEELDTGRKLIGIDELAQKRDLKVSYIRYAKQYQGLPFYKIGGLKFTLDDFDEWARKRRTSIKKG